ncbi:MULTISPECIES: hypothetical protein [Cyanophyceae]|nr:hypothetical protein [Trichocoleus sp. FACHB-69]
MTADYRQKLQQQVANLPAVGSIGLFTQGLELVQLAWLNAAKCH